MRTIILTAVISLTASFAAPAVAQVHTSCQSARHHRRAVEIKQENAHRDFIRECLAGKIPMAATPEAPTTAHVLGAESFGRCQALAEQRGSSTGRAHRDFIAEVS